MTRQGTDAQRLGGPDAMLERIRRYVEAETPTGDEARASELASLIVEDLRAAGCTVETTHARGYGVHILARRAGDARRPLLLLGHYDTVHPTGTLERLPFRLDAGRAYGPGIFDMKAQIALSIEALMRATRARPVIILLTCDEEVGSPTSRPLIERIARECDAVLVLEPPLPDGSAKTARKGVGKYRLEAYGRAAHAGIEPEAGIDAIAELAHQIEAMAALAHAALGTTVTIGRIAGGTASNVVADHAEAEIDVRFAAVAEGERVDAALRALRPRDPRVRLALDGGMNRPPLVRTAESERLYRAARAQAAEAGFELGEGATGGGSDGCFTAAAGVPTLDGLGVPGAGAHTLEEHIRVDALEPRTDFLRRLIENL
ncbi:MAG TPA: M20 family metallopeptidase [Longimicrobiales bacterium]|nr:M20 family metallopeptidase [Longimicrobiales bacterium]